MSPVLSILSNPPCIGAEFGMISILYLAEPFSATKMMEIYYGIGDGMSPCTDSTKNPTPGSTPAPVDMVSLYLSTARRRVPNARLSSTSTRSALLLSSLHTLIPFLWVVSS